MTRLVAACAASLLLYGLLFGVLLGRPLSYGFLEAALDARLARGAALHGPKLVILAGSNAAYSHRCETIEAMLALPCVNAGVAVGIGLDYQFTRWDALLHAGDTLYLPMEQEQYTTTRAAMRVGPDAAIMLRDDRATLLRLPADRWAGALFSTDLRGALMAPIETALVRLGLNEQMRDALVGRDNAWGDHTGHTLALAAASREVLARATPQAPDAQAVRDGHGSALIGDFVRRMAARGVRVVGGLPTGFSDLPFPDATVAAIRAVYLDNGGRFLELPNRSRYPRIDFFDTPEHLNEPCQLAHSAAIAAALAVLLDRTLHPAAQSGPACPSEFPPSGLPPTEFPSPALPPQATAPPVAHPPALAYDAPNIGGTWMGATQ